MRAIEAVGRGEALLDPAVTQRIFQEVRKAAKEEEASAFSTLTQQEKHVLLLVSEGKTNREIAKASIPRAKARYEIMSAASYQS